MTERMPRAERLTLPPDYGVVRRTLDWDDVGRLLIDAPHYWLATVREDGRPHVVPVDGLWQNGGLWFGGSTATVHHANLLRSSDVVVHTEAAMSPVIVEGTAELITPAGADARLLATASRAKYGYADPGSYRSPLWRVTPARVLAWSEFPKDATRFVFG